MKISAWLQDLKSRLDCGFSTASRISRSMVQRRPRRLTRQRLAARVEACEDRVMLTVEPITLTDPQHWGDSASGVSGVVSISADGQRVVFESAASNLVPNDFNGTADVFLYERGTGQVSLISINSDGSGSGDEGGFGPKISPDGRYVVFQSDAGDLVTSPPINNVFAGQVDVYVRDLDTDRTVLISSYFDGSRDSNNYSDTPSIATTSDGGLMVAWATVSAFMTPGDTNGFQDIFVRKLNSNGTLEPTQRVSVGPGGVQANDNSSNPVLSGNGQVVVFVSTANNLVPNDDNTARDIFVHDIATGVTELVTVDTTGLQSANNEVWTTDHPINFDGSRIVFHSAATNLSSLPTGGQTQVFVRDRVTDETRMVSVNAAGTAGIQGYDAGITSNGRFVVFTSDNDNLDPTTPDINFSTDIYLRDLNDQTTRLVSVNAAGTAAGNDDSGARIGFGLVGSLISAVASDDGRYVAFQSRASDLTATLDTNGMKETFVRDRQLGVTRAVAVSPTSSAGNATIDAFFPSAVSADFRFVAVASNATDLINDDANGKQDVFVRDLSQGIVELASRRSPLLPAEQLATAGGTLAAATPDGKFVAFISFNASQFDPDVSSHVDASLFVRNTQTGEISVATVLPNGIQAPNGSVFQASFSNDGRYLAFNTTKVGLDATSSAFGGVYLRDLHTGTSKLISRNTTTGTTANAFSGNNDVVVSPDGRWVAFVNTSTNLVSGVTVSGGQPNLYVYDRVNEELRLVTIATSGTASGDGSSLQSEYRPVFSEDSSRLVYVSKSSDLVAGVTDDNGWADVFAYDLTGANAFQNRLVSQSTTANVPGNFISGGSEGQWAPSVSADGRFVAFASNSTNMAPESTTFGVQVYVRDLVNNTTRLVSLNQSNTSGGNGPSMFPKISADGTRVLFQSGSTNISPIAGNTIAQLYVRNLIDNTTQLVSVSSTGTSGNHLTGALSQGQSDRPVLSANGRYVAFNSRATNLVAGQVQVAQWDLFVRDLATGITVLASANHTGLAGGNSRSSPNSNAAQVYLTNEGRVTFASEASDLFNGDRNLQTDVFAYTYAGGGQISGKLFRDDDGSGAQNGAEPGVVYHTVFLDANGNRRFDQGEVNVQTDSSGNYRFTGLAAGSYTVATEFDTGTQPTVPAAPHTRSVTLATATSSVTGQDFGAQPAVLDLAVDSVTLTPATQPGQQVTVTWIGRNAGANAITTSWQDAVYLSKDGEVDESDLLLTTVAQIDSLGANSAYVETATITLPAVPEGSYFILVRADRRFQIDEPIRTNNLAVSSTTLNLNVPSLSVGSATNVPFAATHPDHYFQFTVTPGEALRLVLNSAAASGLSELLIARGRLPTPADFDFAASAQQPDQELLIPTTQDGTYYVLARAIGGAAATASFSLMPTLVPFGIDGVDVSIGGNTGRVTVGIQGQRFNSETLFRLEGNGTTINTVSTVFRDSQMVFVTFDLSGQPTGVFDVVAVNGSTTVTLPAAFTISETQENPVEINLITPGIIRSGAGSTTVVVEYTNTSNVDIAAPFIELASTFARLRLSDDGDYSGDFAQSSIQFLGISQDGPAGILRAGQRNQMRVFLEPASGIAEFRLDLEVSILGNDDESIDWQAAKSDLRPQAMSTQAWDVVFSNFLSSVGSTPDQFHDVLAENATYLSNLGVRTGNIARLMQFEFSQSAAELPFSILASATDVEVPTPGLTLSMDRYYDASLEGRNRPGTLGFGWSNPWDITMNVESIFQPESIVRVTQGGIERTFFRDTNDIFTYHGAPGDLATVTLNMNSDVSRAVELREPDGTLFVFSRDILDGIRAGLARIEDPAGNRITFSGRIEPTGQILVITHTSGPQLELQFNLNGKLNQVHEFIGNQPTDRVVTYGYDTTFEHLTSVTTTEGTTLYNYVTGQGPARENALASITSPDGTHVFYDYDDQGRLVRVRRDNDVEEVTLGYDSVAGVTFTDAAGSMTILYNDLGLPELVRDALGRTSQFDYDSHGNLLQSISPLGATAQFRYDGRANVIGATDPLGNQLSYTYETQFNQLTSLTDARGNITRYERDANGSLVAITYANGSREVFSRDAEGSLIETVNRRGQATQIVRDAQTGLVTREDFADGSHVDYLYDAARRLLTAAQQIPTDSFPLTRVTTFIYNDADFPDLITRINSFGGRFLEFTYDDGGRRVQSVDQDGFTVKYTYDTVGRLFEVRDGSDGLITRYSYDALSRMTLKENGNGTYTTYEYDAVGQLLHLVNRGPRPTLETEGPVNSRFDYTYDADGRRTSMGTVDGVTQYKYDAAGQLILVTLPDARTIQYEYDPAGNRTRVIDSLLGTTEYAANELNQITSAGDTTFAYDADGNLISESDSTGTTIYTWDGRNQLLGVIGPDGTFRYEYDAFLDRIAADRNGVRTEYLIDPVGLGNIVGEYSGAGRVNYAYGYGLLDRVAGGIASYFDFDALGSTVGITNSAGTYVNRYSYLPFGETTTHSAVLTNIFQFVGEYGVTADGNGLTHMRLRNFSTVTGQFTSDDPIGLAAGDPNIRRYVFNSPTNGIDPLGLYGSIGAGEVFTTFFMGTGTYAQVGVALAEKGRIGAEQYREKAVDQFHKAKDIDEARRALNEIDYADRKITDYTRNRDYYVNQINNKHTHKPNTVPKQFPAAKRRADLDKARKKRLRDFVHNLPGDPAVKGIIEYIFSFDPNDIQGPKGFGPQNYIRRDSTLPYTIHFENLAAASAPALEVFITQPLDDDLDLDSFELGNFGWGLFEMDVPAGMQAFHEVVDWTNPDGSPLTVTVDARLDKATRTVTWAFRSSDPATGEFPADPFAGFLPPNDEENRGQGFVDYLVRAKTNVTTGTEIRGIATIIFDTNDPITTNQIDPEDPSQGIDHNKEALVTIDSGAPVSQVGSLPATSPLSFPVSWSGQDDVGGSGIATYDIYVSDNNGSYTLWLDDTVLATSNFSGENGHTYRFYSVATDNVGLSQSTPASAQAITLAFVNSAPVISGQSTVTYVKGQPATLVAPNVEVNDAQENLGGGTLKFTITDVKFGKKQVRPDVISTTSLNAIGVVSTREFVGGVVSITVQLGANVTATQVRNALRSIQFSTSGKGLKVTTRAIAAQITDNRGAVSNTLTQTIQVLKKVPRPR